MKMRIIENSMTMIKNSAKVFLLTMSYDTETVE